MKRVFVESYGCSANLSDHEMTSGLLEKSGFAIVATEKNSDLNVILTCTVKAPTLNRMIHRIKYLTSLGKPLVVAGCMPKTEQKIIERINPHTSMVGPESVEKIPEAVSKTLEGKRLFFLEPPGKPKVCLPKIRKKHIIGITEIASGCLSSCAYCSVKLARGKLISYPQGLIVKDIKNSLKDKCKEIWVTSQDCGCYGMDNGTNLAELLNKIVKINGNFFVRVGMMNPRHIKNILNDLTGIYKNPKIYKFVHIPVQSGSDRILKLMNRGYKVSDFKKIVKKFRKEIPNVTLSTDIIAGFPTESDLDFRKTLNLVREIKPDIVNISKFGPRLGTPASKMKQIDNKIIKKRSKKLGELTKKTSLENNRKFVGKVYEILINEKGKKPNQWIGRNISYKPVLIESKENLFGKILKTKITRAEGTYLLGEILK